MWKDAIGRHVCLSPGSRCDENFSAHCCNSVSAPACRGGKGLYLPQMSGTDHSGAHSLLCPLPCRKHPFMVQYCGIWRSDIFLPQMPAADSCCKAARLSLLCCREYPLVAENGCPGQGSLHLPQMQFTACSFRQTILFRMH